MGKVKQFVINIGTDRQVFYPGEQICGHVVLHLNQPMKMRGLRIQLKGIKTL